MSVWCTVQLKQLVTSGDCKCAHLAAGPGNKCWVHMPSNSLLRRFFAAWSKMESDKTETVEPPSWDHLWNWLREVLIPRFLLFWNLAFLGPGLWKVMVVFPELAPTQRKKELTKASLMLVVHACFCHGDYAWQYTPSAAFRLSCQRDQQWKLYTELKLWQAGEAWQPVTLALAGHWSWT